MNTLWKILRAEIDYNRIFLFGFHLFSAVCFIVTALYYTAIDIKAVTQHRVIQSLFMFIWFVFYIVVLIQFYVIVNFSGLFDDHNAAVEYILQFSESWLIVILIFIAAILLALIGLNMFQKRKSYL